MDLSEKLQPILKGYKEYFPKHWNNEKFKWEAVKHFQTYWNIDAPNFGAMFEKATEKTETLLTLGNFLPRGMITCFANADDAATRQMFIDLFDESQDLFIRVDKFKAEADRMREKYDDGTWKNHYQNTNAISTYLWLRFPDKYYIYQYSIFCNVVNVLDTNYRPKHDGSAESMIGGFGLYDDICAVIQNDNEIRRMIENAIDDDCWPDKQLHTTTIDIGHYISDYFLAEKQKEKEQAEWFPKDYTPGLSVDDWITLLHDSSVFTPSALQIVKRMKEYGGQATCKQLSIKYGEHPNFYNSGSSTLAKRVVEKTNCPVLQTNTENSKWWPVLYMGKYADAGVEGDYIWRLRPELSEALDKVDLAEVPLYSGERPEDSDESHRYWWLVADPQKWSFSDKKNGEEQYYTLRNENGHKRRIYQNFLDAKAGDVVIGYEASPAKEIVALGKITRANDGKNLYFEKTEELSVPIDYAMLKGCPELEKMEFFVQPNGSLFKLTKGEFDFIMDMIREKNPVKQSDASFTEFAKPETVGKDILYYGVPGSGKSFKVKEEIKKHDSELKRIERVVFHPEYTYSDFVGQILPRVIEKEGEEPNQISYDFMPGPFTRILQKANNDKGHMHYLVIEEINRGNTPAIFGDIFQLLDRKYLKDDEGTIEYGKSEYGVTNEDIAKEVYGNKNEKVELPPNLTIYATMNTSDQNVFTLDTAFQRRWEMELVENKFGDHGKDVIGGSSITWGQFASVINDKILSTNDALLSSEDKRLGAFFVTKEEVENTEKFSQKVLKYLWDDAFKLNRSDVFQFQEGPNSLETVIKKYREAVNAKGDPLKAVFKEELYNKMSDQNNDSTKEDAQEINERAE